MAKQPRSENGMNSMSNWGLSPNVPNANRDFIPNALLQRDVADMDAAVDDQRLGMDVGILLGSQEQYRIGDI